MNLPSIGDVLNTAKALTQALQILKSQVFDRNAVQSIPTSAWVTAITTPAIAPALSLLSVSQWRDLFAAKPDLPPALAPKLWVPQIACMGRALEASATLTQMLSANQLERYFEACGLGALQGGWSPVVLQNLNAKALALSLSAQSSQTLGTVSAASWASLDKSQPGLSKSLARPLEALQIEAKRLPTGPRDALQKVLQNHQIDAYENPLISGKALSREPLVGQTFLDAQTVIAAYDQAYTDVIAKAPQDFDALSTLYSQLLSRASLSSNAVSASVLPTLSNQLFGFLTTAHNAMMPLVPPSTGTDVQGYVLTVNGLLKNEIGKFKNVNDLIGQISQEIQSLGAVVLDNTTQLHYDPKVMQWLLDGAPVAAAEGNLAYAGQTGQTFAGALTLAMKDLFIEADQFVRLCQSGIGQVVANKSVADTRSLISQIFDIVGGVASLGAGLGKTYAAFQSLTGLGNQIKAVSELASDVNTVSGVVKNEVNDWLTPQKSAVSGQTQYNHFSDSVTDLTQVLSSYGALSGEVRGLKDQFVVGYRQLIKTIADQLRHGADLLGQNTVSAHYSPEEFSRFGPYKNIRLDIDASDFSGHRAHYVVPNGEYLREGVWEVSGPQLPGYLYTSWQIEQHIDLGVLDPKFNVHTTLKAYGYNVI